MKHFAILGLAIAGAVTSTPSTAAIRYEEGPQPVTTYNVCNYNAVFEVNTQARRLRAGGPSLVIGTNTATLTQSPSVFLQTRRLVRNAYQSLSLDPC